MMRNAEPASAALAAQLSNLKVELPPPLKSMVGMPSDAGVVDVSGFSVLTAINEPVLVAPPPPDFVTLPGPAAITTPLYELFPLMLTSPSTTRRPLKPSGIV